MPQLAAHLPATQASPAPHFVPQAPQLALSVWTLVQAPAHVTAPEEQLGAAGLEDEHEARRASSVAAAEITVRFTEAPGKVVERLDGSRPN